MKVAQFPNLKINDFQLKLSIHHSLYANALTCK